MTKSRKVSFVVVAGGAIVCFVYAVCTLGFQVGGYSCARQHVNAGILAALWAIGPPVWFLAERSIWGTEANEKKMEKAQANARDLWLGLGAIVLFLADKNW